MTEHDQSPKSTEMLEPGEVADPLLATNSKIKYADLIFSFHERMETPDRELLTPKLIVSPHVLKSHYALFGDPKKDNNRSIVNTSNQLNTLVQFDGNGTFLANLNRAIKSATTATSHKDLHVRDSLIGFVILTNSLIRQEGLPYATGLSNLLATNTTEVANSTEKILPKIESDDLNFHISPAIDSRYQIPKYQSELKDYVDYVVSDKSFFVGRGFELGVIAALNFNEIWWERIHEIGDFSTTQVSTGSTPDLTSQNDLPFTS